MKLCFDFCHSKNALYFILYFAQLYNIINPFCPRCICADALPISQCSFETNTKYRTHMKSTSKHQTRIVCSKVTASWISSIMLYFCHTFKLLLCHLHLPQWYSKNISMAYVRARFNLTKHFFFQSSLFINTTSHFFRLCYFDICWCHAIFVDHYVNTLK